MNADKTLHWSTPGRLGLPYFWLVALRSRPFWLAWKQRRAPACGSRKTRRKAAYPGWRCSSRADRFPFRGGGVGHTSGSSDRHGSNDVLRLAAQGRLVGKLLIQAGDVLRELIVFLFEAAALRIHLRLRDVQHQIRSEERRV